MPGAGKQSPETQKQIKELLEAGFDPTTIHRRLKVGRSSIYRMKRSLQRHGTAYMPPELNKKNGRPKVLTAQQELEVHTWLRNPSNRQCYLDDLVWLIHDRFGIVCSTTTMSKLKRKWLAVIESEEGGMAEVDGGHSGLELLAEQHSGEGQSELQEQAANDESAFDERPEDGGSAVEEERADDFGRVGAEMEIGEAAAPFHVDPDLSEMLHNDEREDEVELDS